MYRSNATNQRWVRIKSSVRFLKETDAAQLFFEHSVDQDQDRITIAFTYPYSYTQIQNELDAYGAHQNNFDAPGSLFFQRELLTRSCDGRRIDLLTISSVDGMSKQEREPLLPGLFPETTSGTARPPLWPAKEVVFVSARVHAGEVPAQHTFKGILSLLMDPDDLIAKELRARYVFKLIPVLNPDGVFRGHFRMDQLGQNLNRYYNKPDPLMQPAIFATKSLLDYHSQTSQLALYLDFHAHASKRGCFIYGNVLESIEDQVQNQLFCKLISMNTPHFDYEGCLFSKEHMFRIDPGDQAKGLTAEGSGRVATYLAYGLVHSYTIECNYNTSRIGNEVSPMENDFAGPNVTASSPFTTNPEKYTPNSYASVGRACVTALLDLRGHNPCSRIPKSKFKTLDRVRNAVLMEVRSRKEYFGKVMNRERKRSVQERRVMNSCSPSSDEGSWKRVVDADCLLVTANSSAPTLAPTPLSSKVSSDAGIIFISAKEPRGRRSRPPSAQSSCSSSSSAAVVLPLTAANLLAKENAAWAAAAASAGHSSDEDEDSPRGERKRTASANGDHMIGGSRALNSSSKQSLHVPHTQKGPVLYSSSSGMNQRMRSMSLGRTGVGRDEGADADAKDPTDSSLSKLIRMQYPYPPGTVPGPTAPTVPREPAFSKRSIHKDNRKILGKTLHAAGVALLMGTGGLQQINNDRPASGNNAARVPGTGIAYIYDDVGDEMPATHTSSATPPPLELLVTGMGSNSRSSSRAGGVTLDANHG